MIKEFRGKYRWLSNFVLVDILFDGRIFPSVEHAYMSAKSSDEMWKNFCSNSSHTPGYVKNASKSIELIPHWDDIKVNIMKELLWQKFNKEPFRINLLNTGNDLIQEGNSWGDTFWGVDLKTEKGQNNLGKIIMDIRSKLRIENALF